MSSVPIAAKWFSSIGQFLKPGSKRGLVCRTANLMGFVQGEKKRIFVVGNPFVTAFFRVEEENVVAEPCDYVHIERSSRVEE